MILFLENCADQPKEIAKQFEHHAEMTEIRGSTVKQSLLYRTYYGTLVIFLFVFYVYILHVNYWQ